MGQVLRKALRPVKSFNIENRADRVLSKEKPDAAPHYASTADDIKRAFEYDPNLNEKLDKRDSGLDDRLRNVYVTSLGRPERDITEELKSMDKSLPQNRNVLEKYEFGFKVPENIPYGRTTLRHAIDYISSHQASPEEVTASKIAFEYKLKESDVNNILKYFRTFEVYVPETKDSKARFAGPSKFRQIAEKQKKQLENKSSKQNEMNET